MFEQTIMKVAYAVSVAEGWYSHGIHIGGIEPSTSYINHNPGNLRISEYQSGIKNGFAYFENDIIGFFALIRQLEIAASGNHSLYPLGINIKEMFAIYTGLPEYGKQLDDYVNIITKYSKLSADMPADYILK